MATKYTDTCLQKAADDEPIFVLRAQDLLAPGVVRHWAELYCITQHGSEHLLTAGDCTDPKVREALALADKMEQWPTRKLPD